MPIGVLHHEGETQSDINSRPFRISIPLLDPHISRNSIGRASHCNIAIVAITVIIIALLLIVYACCGENGERH